MKKLTLLVACIFAGITAHGATVNWQAGVDTGFATSTGAALTQGNYIRLGYFSFNPLNTTAQNDAAVVALANPTVTNVGTLNSNFVQFGQAQVGDTFGLDGFFQKASAFSYAANPTFNTTKQMYMWVMKASNNTSLSAAMGTVTQQAIFYEPFGTGTSPNAAQWQFPATDISTAKSPDIGDAKTSLGGVYLAGSYQASNAALSAILASPAGAVQLQAVASSPVPEPSTLAVGVLTILTAAGVRRRRQQ